MELREYDEKMVLAALEMKGMNRSCLAKQIGRASGTVVKAIKGTNRIVSKRLENDIVEALQPDLDWIYNMYKEKELKGEYIPPNIKPRTRAPRKPRH